MGGVGRRAAAVVDGVLACAVEALLRGATQVTTDTARVPALQRCIAVRHALVVKGLPSERLFLGALKLRRRARNDAAWLPRMQLALGTN